MSQSLAPILDESFSLAKESLQIVGRMPKAFKFTLGTKISEKTLQLLSDVSAATVKQDRQKKSEYLNAIQFEATELLIFWRLAHQLKLVSDGLYPKILLHLTEIQNQASALEHWAQKGQNV